MQVTAEIPSRPADLERALEGWIDRSRAELRAHPHWPRLYASGTRYQREPKGREKWQTLAETLGALAGDCEDLTIARVAELRETGEDPGARPKVIRTRSSLLHALVQRGDGTYEDPSRKLGMGRERARHAKGKDTMAGDDGQISRARVKLDEHADGAKGTLQWRGAKYQITVEAVGPTKAEAIERTMAIARKVVQGLVLVAKQDPAFVSVAKTLLPPQAMAAIKVGAGLAKLAKRGGLFKHLGKLKGPALQLAKAMGE